jgi:hypothetical protein
VARSFGPGEGLGPQLGPCSTGQRGEGRGLLPRVVAALLSRPVRHVALNPHDRRPPFMQDAATLDLELYRHAVLPPAAKRVADLLHLARESGADVLAHPDTVFLQVDAEAPSRA